MKVPMLDLCRQQASIQSELDAVIGQVISHAHYISDGQLTSFEKKLAARCQCPHAVGVGSGTAALQLALLASGIGPGDDVITAPNSFFATAEAIMQTGARPVFADVDPSTHLITPQSVLEVLTDNVRAVVPVHLFGGVVDVTGIQQALLQAGRGDVKMIEDCAHAAVSSRSGLPVPIGRTGAFSFNPGKNIGALGDAGAVVTHDDEVAQTVRLLRDHGRFGKNEHLLVGFNFRLDRLNDEVLDLKMDYLDEWNARRQTHAAHYDAAFEGCDGIVPVSLDAGVVSARHQYVITCPARDQLRAHLQQHGISTGIHYPMLITDQKPLRNLNYDSAQTPVAARLNRELVSLPCYPELKSEEVDYVIEHTLAFVQSVLPV